MPKDMRPSSPGIARIALAPGVRVGGAGFTLKRLIGRGGFSEVWLARDRKREQDVALKFLPHTLLQDASLVERLAAEVRRCQQLDHPAIAKIFDVSLDYESLAVAMEYINGWSLAALRIDRPEKRYSTEEVLGYLRQLCPALDYAHHDFCLVHRDLKPANLLIDPRGNLKLTDYGLSQIVRSALAQQGHLIYGALSFLPPQQVKGAEPSVLDDVYAVGATVFDLLTGTPPFYKGEILAQVLEQPPPNISERWQELAINASIPRAWEDTIAACLAKAPSARPQTAGEILQGIESPTGIKRVTIPLTPKRDAPPAAEFIPEPKPTASPATAEISESPPSAAPEPAPDTPRSEEPTGDPAVVVHASASVAVATPEPAISESPITNPESADAEPGSASSRALEPEPGQVLPSVASVSDRSSPFKPSLQRYTLLSLGILAGLVLLTLMWVGRGQAGRSRHGPPGSLDPSFHPGAGADNEIRALALQPNGNILIGGRFSTLDQTAIKGVARLRPDGSPDTNFSIQVNGTVHAIALQSDGKILIGGDFMRVGGTPRRRLARLTAAGMLDTSFDPKGAANREVRAILIQEDGRIVAGGSFDGGGGNRHPHITRLNRDGSHDTSFTPGAGANSAVFALAAQSNGKLLVAGDFTRYDNTPCGRIARIDANGALDASFKTDAGATATVLALYVQPDDKILMAGNFSTVANQRRTRIARLNADGSLDQTFDPGDGPNAGVRSLALEPGGKVLAAGTFDLFGNVARRGIARLNSDGHLDSTFDPGEGADGLWRVALQPDMGVLVAGAFTNFNRVACGRIARLYGGAAKSK